LKRNVSALTGLVLFLCMMPLALAQDAASIEVLRTAPVAGGGQAYSLTLQALGLVTLLTLLPAIVLSMTAFTRVVIVLGLLRQAMGTASTPPNQVIVGLALFITFFVMAPTFDEVQRVALTP
jgi:flagellar biosynthetic protein FliP